MRHLPRLDAEEIIHRQRIQAMLADCEAIERACLRLTLIVLISVSAGVSLAVWWTPS